MQGYVRTHSTHIQKGTGREEDKDKERVKNEYKIHDLNPHTGEMDRGSNTLMDSWLKKSAVPTRPAARTYFHLLSSLSYLILFKFILPAK